MSKALIILAEGTEEIEAITAIDTLRRSGIAVIIGGVEHTVVVGGHGIPLHADARIKDLLREDFDVIVIPGGQSGADRIADSRRTCELIRRHDQEGRLIAAICASPAVVLAPLGILDGKRATCYPGFEERFSATTTPSTERVVVDGHVITSRGPGTALEFALAVVEKLQGPTAAHTLAERMVAPVCSEAGASVG